MPWNCSICDVFAADDLKVLLNHIGRCHRNEPNFHCICGIDGCVKTYKKYYSWRKHIQKKHSVVNTGDSLDGDMPEPMNIDANDPEEDNVNTKEITRASALYLLKLQEECFLPKTTVKGVVENTKTIVQETLSVVKTQVEQCLSKNNIEPQGVPGLKSIFQESSAITNPFNDLETESQQNTYYKENFQLKVGKYFNCEIWGWQIERIWYIQNRNCTIFYSPQKLMFICYCRGLTKKIKTLLYISFCFNFKGTSKDYPRTKRSI